MCTFNQAVNAFLVNPSPATLLLLNNSALPLVQTPRARQAKPVRSCWQKVTDFCAFDASFTRLRITIDRRLSDAEVDQVAQCVGYGLKEALAGDTLVVTNIMRSYDAQQTILICEYDSSQSLRTFPDAGYALHLAAQYVQDGTPLRVSNRSGAGTKGTRLVSGLGVCDVAFAVR